MTITYTITQSHKAVRPSKILQSIQSSFNVVHLWTLTIFWCHRGIGAQTCNCLRWLWVRIPFGKINYIHNYTNYGTGAQVCDCKLDWMWMRSEIYIFICFVWCRGKARRWVPLLKLQFLRNSTESGELRVLTTIFPLCEAEKRKNCI